MNDARGTRSPRTGFTLVEALLALAILAGAVVGILGVRANCVRGAARTRAERTAAMMAQRVLTETLLAAAAGDGSRRTHEDYPGYSYRVVTEETTLDGLGPVRRVRVQVYDDTTGAKGLQEEVLSVETLVPINAD